MKKLSGEFYLGSLITSFVVMILASLGMYGAEGSDLGDVCAVVTILASLYYIVVFLVLMYKMWAALQPLGARTTPGKAIGLAFIPLFNLYWVYVMTWGFAKDFNAHAADSGVTSMRIPESRLLAYSIMAPLNFVPGLGLFTGAVRDVLFLSTVGSIVRGVNSLPWVGQDAQVEAVAHPEARDWDVQPTHP